MKKQRIVIIISIILTAIILWGLNAFYKFYKEQHHIDRIRNELLEYMFDGKDISCPQLEELYNQYDGLLSYDGGDFYKCELTDELIKEVEKWDDFPNVGFNKSYLDIEELENVDYIKNISNGKFKVVNYSDGGSQIYGNSFCLCLIDFDSNLLYYIRHWQ